MVDSAALWVRGGVVQPAQASVRDRSRAHGARLECYIKIDASEPLAAKSGRGLADDQHFRMRSRIGKLAGAVTGARDHGALVTKRGADRCFTAELGRTRFGERDRHRIDALALFNQIALPVQAQAFFVWRRAAFGLRTSGAWRQYGGAETKRAMNDEERQGASEVRPGQRIAKVIARAGVCSRREAEAWIMEGRVTVNGAALSSPAFNVSETDDVSVDGKPLAAPERTRLFLFHKPRGLVTTARDPEGRPTVFAALPLGLPRLIAVGRLDINTEGLLLLTNDGGLARVLELPSTGWLRRYRVRVHGSIDQPALYRLRDGVTIDGVDYREVEAKLDREQGANAWLTLGLREGKNREIKKLVEHLGLAVNRLIRVSFGPFELGDLKGGEVVEVRTRVLRDQLGAKLAKEAGVNFDAPLLARDELPEPRQVDRPRSERGPREHPRPKLGIHGRPGRGGDGIKRRLEQDGEARHSPPKPSTPERRRKHVSALRAEIAADAATLRKRVARSATQDRKGRTIVVERRSRDDNIASTLPGREPLERGRRPTPTTSNGARHGKGLERVGPSHGAGTAPRGAFKPNGERDGQRKARKSDERKGERSSPRDAPSREGDRRSERGSRSEFKPRGGGPASHDGFHRSRSVGRSSERSGQRLDNDRGASAKPSGAGPTYSQGRPTGRGPRRPPRRS